MCKTGRIRSIEGAVRPRALTYALRAPTVAALIALLSACGGAQPNVTSPSLIVRHTTDVGRARVSGTIKYLSASNPNAMIVSGTVEFANNSLFVSLLAPNGVTTKLMSIGARIYVKDASDIRGDRWCEADSESASAIPAIVNPAAILGSLGSSQLLNLGKTWLDDAEVTHFRVTRSGAVDADIWVDQSDRLRRVVQRVESATVTMDFSDFSTALSSMKAPSVAAPCLALNPNL